MNKIIVVSGPTACGKTALAVELAKLYGGEVISADSMQIYTDMDVASAKATPEEQQGIPHHLMNFLDPSQSFSVAEWVGMAGKCADDILARGKTPVICGGTGLYVEAVLRGYRLAAVPENKKLRERLEGKSLAELTEMLAELKRRNGSVMHNTTDVDTAKRAIRAIEIETFNGENPTAGAELPPIDSLIVGLDIGREERRRRITERLRQRLDSGMVDEVRSLLESGVAADDLIYYGLEYKYVTEYAIGRIGYDEMFAQLEIAIHQFAKRQMTWFRGMERRGLHIHWIDAMRPVAEKVDEIIRMM